MWQKLALNYLGRFVKTMTKTFHESDQYTIMKSIALITQCVLIKLTPLYTLLSWLNACCHMIRYNIRAANISQATDDIVRDNNKLTSHHKSPQADLCICSLMHSLCDTCGVITLNPVWTVQWFSHAFRKCESLWTLLDKILARLGDALSFKKLFLTITVYKSK